MRGCKYSFLMVLFVLLFSGFPSRLSSEITKPALPNVRIAFYFSGANAGAKIAAAIADLPATGGTVDARGLEGSQVISAALTIGATDKPVTVLLGAATCTLSAGITVNAGSSLVGLQGTGNGPGAGDTAYDGTQLVQAAGVNLPFMVNLAGTNSSIRDMTVSGNQANNPTALDGIKITGLRALVERVTTQNHKRHGIYIVSTGDNNEAAGPQLEKVHSLNNGSDGLLITNTTDLVSHMAYFENNGAHGAELSNSSGARLVEGDFGGNTGYGLYSYGLSTSWGGIGMIIVGNQFGNNLQHDIFINGWDSAGGAVASIGHTITGNYFNGLGSTATNNTWNAIMLTDSGYNNVTGNTIRNNPAAGPHRFKYGIQVNDTTGTREKSDIIALNKFIGTFGTDLVTSSTTNTSFLLNSVDGAGGGGIGIGAVPSALLNLYALTIHSGTDINIQIRPNGTASLLNFTNDADNATIPVELNASGFAIGSTSPPAAGVMLDVTGKGAFTSTVKLGTSTFANLGTPVSGTIVWCSDCDPSAVTYVTNDCASVGAKTGAMATRYVATWGCLSK